MTDELLRDGEIVATVGTRKIAVKRNWTFIRLLVIRQMPRHNPKYRILSTSCTRKLLGVLCISKKQHLELKMTIGLDNINSHFSRTSQMDHQTLSYITSLSLPKIESFDLSPVFSEDINPIHSFRRGGKWRHRSHMIVTILDYVLLEYLITLIFHSTLVSFPLYEIMLSLHLNPKILTLLSLNNFDQYLFFIFF